MKQAKRKHCRKQAVSVLLTVCLLAGALTGCAAPSVPDETEAPAVAYDAVTQTLTVRQTAEDTQITIPAPSVPDETEAPAVAYDAVTQTLTVRQTAEDTQITIPAEAANARVLEVSGSDYTLCAYLTVLREGGLDLQTELPGMIDRTAKSLRFIRQYLRDNAGAAYPSDLADLPVVLRIDRVFGYQTAEDQITLRYLDIGTHREFLYLLALMNSDAVGWEQLGYAWYVGTCIDPYSEVENVFPIVPTLPYYPQCIAGGVDPEHVTASDYRTVYDACARVGFERGLTHWGSWCESTPVTSEDAVFTRFQDMQPGDSLLTAFTAASFLAWLDEAHGFEAVSLFCFGKKSFKEAFRTDFQSAYYAWRNWIIETYPAE